MESGKLNFTAVYMNCNGEYVGFVEELPTMNVRGRTLHDAREALQKLAAEMFEDERRISAQAHAPDSVVRETFVIPIKVNPKLDD